MTRTQENIKDVEFIFEQINMNSTLSMEERRFRVQNHNLEFLCTVPHPNGGRGITCGKQADERFRKIAVRHLSTDAEKKSKTNVGNFVKALKESFSKKFLQEQRDIEEGSVARMISQAYKQTQKSFSSQIHYIPCTLFTNKEPLEFSIGPVKFFHKTKFEELYKERFSEQRKVIADRIFANDKEGGKDISRESAIKFANMKVDDILKFFSPYQWIAVVKIGPCDNSISKTRANLSVKGALNILRLLFRDGKLRDIRTGYDLKVPDEIFYLSEDINANFHISMSKHWGGLNVSDDWLKQVEAYNYDFYLKAAGETLKSIINPTSHFPLSQRFLDSLNWYGEAMQETIPAAQLIKFVSSMERMTITGEEEGVSRILINRSAILAHNIEKKDLDLFIQKLKEIYRFRSDLLHGSLSPLDESINPIAGKAKVISREVLFAGIDLFASLGLFDPTITNEKLKTAYVKEEFKYGLRT